MINNSEFADRLRHVMDYYQLSASGFADRIQVQRSSISHLLSGRNKPSLDFVLRVIKEFEEVELYWLLNGKGSFPAASHPTPIEKEPEKPASTIEESPSEDPKGRIITSDPTKKIERIVIFFEDGTFKEYLK
jgi:transcriptional regulator with XRE-family HTH domain